MSVSLDDLVAKRNACIDALDFNKTCVTCCYEKTPPTDAPCKSCYDELLGMPVNPTNWEPIEVL